jgi:hypothetical protein
MSVGDGISGLGATRHKWVPAVRHQVQLVLNSFPQLTANTYVCHPWCGWGRWSVDFWGAAGRGDAAPLHLLRASRQLLLTQPGPPLIRHTILEHDLWTSFGGWSRWVPDDHSGELRHLHVTFWRG